MNALTAKLLDLNFLPVLNIEENSGFGDPIQVLSGKPSHFDINNGIMAVYDNAGAPWIISLSKISRENIAGLVDHFHLIRGAYVPFSNDRHYFDTKLPTFGQVS